MKNIILSASALIFFTACSNPFTTLYVPDPIYSITADGKNDRKLTKNATILNATFKNETNLINIINVEITNLLLEDTKIIDGIILKSKDDKYNNKVITSGTLISGTLERMPINKNYTNLITNGEDDEKFISIEIDKFDYSSVDKNKVYNFVQESYALSTDSCEEHLTHLMSNVATNNTVNGFLALGLTVASAVTNHVKTSTDLAIGATSVIASGAILNKEVMFDQIVPIIIDVIKTGRKIKKVAIDSKLNSSTYQYKLGEAFNDIKEYHNLCSLKSGLVNLKDSLNYQKINPIQEIENTTNYTKEIAFIQTTLESIDDVMVGSDVKEIAKVKDDLIKRWKYLVSKHTAVNQIK